MLMQAGTITTITISWENENKIQEYVVFIVQ